MSGLRRHTTGRNLRRVSSEPESSTVRTRGACLLARSLVGVVGALLVSASAIAGGAEPLRIKLPFTNGASFTCNQGNHGAESHSDGVNDFAYDFDLPEGTPVLAAASGRVLWAVDEFTEGGNDESLKMRSNRVWIDHGGGRLTVYDHLQRGTVRVVAGQLVNAGQVIARSGSTGYSTGPHLHFAVTDVRWQSLPASFVDFDGGVPKTGDRCTSRNDGRGASWFRADSTLAPDTFEADGVVLDVALPAIYWSADDVHPLRGAMIGAGRAARFFVAPYKQYDPIFGQELALKEARFDSAIRVSAFEAALPPIAMLQYGVARVEASGKYHCSKMVGLVVWRDTKDAAGKLVAPMRVPFRETVTCPYSVEPAAATAAGDAAIAFEVQSKTPVLACASGRVVVAAAKIDVHGASESKSRVAAAVVLDHGDGVTTTYVGLEPSSIRVRAGDIVGEGDEFALSARAPWRAPANVVLRVAGSARRSPRFAELGESGTFAASGTLSKAARRASALVFRADSLAAEASFAAQRVARVSGAPAFAYHVGTTYALRGAVDAGTPSVAFLVRKRGRGESRVVATSKPTGGEFALDVKLGDEKAFAADDAWEWTLTGVGAPAYTATSWLPLVPMR